MEPVSLPSKSCHQCPDIWCLVSARARGRAGVLWPSLHVRILCPVVLRQCKLAEIRPIPVSSDSMPGKVIVYGGRGGLGVVVVSTFRQAGYEVLYCMYCSVLYCTGTRSCRWTSWPTPRPSTTSSSASTPPGLARRNRSAGAWKRRWR